MWEYIDTTAFTILCSAYRDALEARIRDAADNVAAFNDGKAASDDRRIMNSTSSARMACHLD
jgi:hypothetical protein